MNALDPIRLKTLLPGTLFQAVYCFPEVNSTNTQLMMAARYGEPEGTVYAAERQTAGRGRFSRPWLAPEGKALLFSILLYPDCGEERQGLLPMLLALSAAEAIEQWLEDAGMSQSVEVKWPNDVLVSRRKIAGVLAERERVQSGRRTALVIGMGMNVNQALEELPPRPVFPATSLLHETGRMADREALLAGTLHKFSHYYGKVRELDCAELIEPLRRRMTTLGQPIAVNENGRRIEGIAVGLSQRGGLLVRLTSGVEREFLAADVEGLDWR